ncbi:MAG: hypothetical protein KGL93_03550 [Gemmatimonadota bacterium]|nr:hypothetical protein [Gemmatimonadota bacterium]HEU4990182.1 hypothetical protein [Gemmatimonadaceae bacterium]
MLLNALLAMALAAAVPPDTAPPARPLGADSVPAIPFTVQPPADTGYHPRPRPRAIEYDDSYYTRLEIHRDLSYAIYPLYVGQYIFGRELWNKSSAAPTWAKTGHRVFATALVGVFGANTVTGLWNLWDSRHDPDHRVLRTVHAITMLAADGAFSYAGSTLATQAQNSIAKRRLHRTITLSAMGVTTLSALIMTFYNR